MVIGCFFFVAVIFALQYYHNQHPLNYVLLGIFTVSMAFMVGMSCAFTSGKLLFC